MMRTSQWRTVRPPLWRRGIEYVAQLLLNPARHSSEDKIAVFGVRTRLSM